MATLPLAWITGAGGLIGHHLLHSGPVYGVCWNTLGLTRDRLDLLDFPRVRETFRLRPPQLIIHCAALSSSLACQADPAFARRINVEATAVLAELAAHIPLFFLSTDLVFDGRTGNYSESAAVHPLSVYGETKAQTETIVLSNPLHTVIRCSLVGGVSPSGNRGFNEQLRRAWQAGQTVNLFVDEFRTPLPAGVVAR